MCLHSLGVDDGVGPRPARLSEAPRGRRCGAGCAGSLGNTIGLHYRSHGFHPGMGAKIHTETHRPFWLGSRFSGTRVDKGHEFCHV